MFYSFHDVSLLGTLSSIINITLIVQVHFGAYEVIGIAGGSGSGKTTYSNNLGKSLDKFKVKIISTDDYFKELKPIVKAPYNGKEFVDYDHPTSVDLDRLSRDFNHAISSNLFDIVIVEGLMVLYFEEIREKINLKYMLIVLLMKD